MLSNAYFLAKFRFDTAENEPAKNLQNFVNFPNFANPNPEDANRWSGGERALGGAAGRQAASHAHAAAVASGLRQGCGSRVDENRPSAKAFTKLNPFSVTAETLEVKWSNVGNCYQRFSPTF